MEGRLVKQASAGSRELERVCTIGEPKLRFSREV